MFVKSEIVVSRPVEEVQVRTDSCGLGRVLVLVGLVSTEEEEAVWGISPEARGGLLEEEDTCLSLLDPTRPVR